MTQSGRKGKAWKGGANIEGRGQSIKGAGLERRDVDGLVFWMSSSRGQGGAKFVGVAIKVEESPH